MNRPILSVLAPVLILLATPGCDPAAARPQPEVAQKALAAKGEPDPVAKGETIAKADRITDGDRLKKLIGDDPVAREIPNLAGISQGEQAKLLKWFLSFPEDKLVELVTETRVRRDIARSERAVVARSRIKGLIASLEAKGVKAADLPVDFRVVRARQE